MRTSNMSDNNKKVQPPHKNNFNFRSSINTSIHLYWYLLQQQRDIDIVVLSYDVVVVTTKIKC